MTVGGIRQLTLPPEWFYLDKRLAAAMRRELDVELRPGHLLHGRLLHGIAKSGANDDVVFAEKSSDSGEDDVQAWWLVHLTWSGRPEQYGPHAEPISFPADLWDPWEDYD